MRPKGSVFDVAHAQETQKLLIFALWPLPPGVGILGKGGAVDGIFQKKIKTKKNESR